MLFLLVATFQLVYPAYTTLLEHIHSKALDDFKTKLDQSLNNGEGFASSVRTWTQTIMLEFDNGAAGNILIQFFIACTTVSDFICMFQNYLKIGVPMLA